MEIKNIAWTYVRDVVFGNILYGVAHNSQGEAIGGVRIDNHDNGVSAVTYNLSFRPFDEKVRSTKISSHVLFSKEEIKKRAGLALKDFLTAA